MLSPHFTIHLNGFVPSFSVNLFYKKKFWALSSILDKNQYYTKVFWVMLRKWKEKKPMVGFSQCQPWALSFFWLFWAWWEWCNVMAKDGISSVSSPISPRALLETKPLSASEVVFTSGTALATLQRAWEPQFRIWLPEVVLSADLGERPARFLAPFNFQHMFTSLCSSPSRGGWQF